MFLLGLTAWIGILSSFTGQIRGLFIFNHCWFFEQTAVIATAPLFDKFQILNDFKAKFNLIFHWAFFCWQVLNVFIAPLLYHFTRLEIRILARTLVLSLAGVPLLMPITLVAWIAHWKLKDYWARRLRSALSLAIEPFSSVFVEFSKLISDFCWPFWRFLFNFKNLLRLLQKIFQPFRINS